MKAWVAKRSKGRSTWPRRALAAAAAVLMGLPGAAHPVSLSQLLRLPLEELLRLKIQGPVTAPHLRSGDPLAPSTDPQRRGA